MHRENLNVGSTEVNFLHTHYILPGWLDSFIFNYLGARIGNDPAKVMSNLGNSHLDNLYYLGTYFPRTYAEIRTIMKKLNEETDYFTLEEIKNQRRFRILSVGCGTGGDVVSLIDCVKEITGCKFFSVTLIDGNEDALDTCQKIISMQEMQKGLTTRIEVINQTIKEPSDFHRMSKQMSDSHKFDFIITSKFINELISNFHNAYSNFVSGFSTLLARNGLIIITDTTDKRRYNGTFAWIPEIMNYDINNNISVHAGIGTIMPPPCNCSGCNRSCYTCFENEYSSRKNDSRITFRILAKKVIKDKISYPGRPNLHNYIVSSPKSGISKTCQRLNSSSSW